MPDFTASITEILRDPARGIQECADDIAAAAEEHYRPRVETIEQLDALPVGAVLKEDWPSTDGGAIWERWNSSEPDGEWVRLDSCAHIPGRKPFLPAVVLYLPEGADE
jgi:hypothetical protein